MTHTPHEQHPAMPLVNLNGSSIEDLMVQTLVVHRAATRLLKLLSPAAPHGRDYPHTDHALGAAQEAWLAAVEGGKAAHRWAELRLLDLARQNQERDPDKATAVVTAAGVRADEIISRKAT